MQAHVYLIAIFWQGCNSAGRAECAIKRVKKVFNKSIKDALEDNIHAGCSTDSSKFVESIIHTPKHLVAKPQNKKPPRRWLRLFWRPHGDCVSLALGRFCHLSLTLKTASFLSASKQSVIA
jgi:hypothetical protein